MRRSLSVMAVAFIALTTGLATAQNASASANSDRKVSTRVAPNYPDLAKRMHMRGVVRIEAVVRPNGSVKSTRVLGGNPVLTDAAVEAVTKWKFEAGPDETSEVVQLMFTPQ